MLKKNQILKTKILSHDLYGFSIAKEKQFEILIPFGLKDEILEIKIIKEKPLVGKINKIIFKNPKRILSTFSKGSKKTSN